MRRLAGRLWVLISVCVAAGTVANGPAQDAKKKAPIPAAALAGKGQDPADSFFNGKDLRGWSGLKEYWSVKDGAIVGFTPRDPGHNTFLCSDKPYRDFELKFRVRLKLGYYF